MVGPAVDTGKIQTNDILFLPSRSSKFSHFSAKPVFSSFLDLYSLEILYPIPIPMTPLNLVLPKQLQVRENTGLTSVKFPYECLS